MLIGRDRAISKYQKVNNSKSWGYLENKLGQLLFQLVDTFTLKHVDRMQM